MSRLDVVTSPTDAPWLRERYEKGDPSHSSFDQLYRSLRTETYDNTRLTKQQIAAMEAEYPPEMIDVEMRGFFPDWGLTMFPSGHVWACIDQGIYDAVYIALNPEKGNPEEGYVLEEDPRHGVFRFEMPAVPGRRYISTGDPGMGDFPARNAGVVAVFDVENPNDKKLVYFHWVSGRGSYNPFLASYRYVIDKYNPVLKGLDATGPQKALDELAFQNNGIEVDGLNFGRDKTAMLNALSLDITRHRIKFPPIKGLIRQLSNYKLEDDKRLAQDIVMTICQVSFLAQNLPKEAPRKRRKTTNHRSRRHRTAVSGRRR